MNFNQMLDNVICKFGFEDKRTIDFACMYDYATQEECEAEYVRLMKM